MSAKSLKVLACGDVEGRFSQIFNRVSAIQKKSGPFDLLLCVGDFFGDNDTEWKDYKSGKLKVPIATLILGATNDRQASYYTEDGQEMCENVTYLGKKGTYTESSGLQIAYLSGLESSSEEGDNSHFGRKDTTGLTLPVIADTKYKGVDILITSQWPKNVQKYASAIEGIEDGDQLGSEAVAEVARILQPRYHFAGLSGIFYERQPYRNHKVIAESSRHATRFIGLAKVGNKQKKKFLYAFNVVPLNKMESAELNKTPQDSTECPFPMSRFWSSNQIDDTDTQFFYNMSGKNKQGSKHKSDFKDGVDRKKQKKQPQATGPCWFCLGSPEVEKHLVVSVGTECYVALAKGGLVPEHVLILPIGHHQSTVSSPQDVRDEIDQYKSCLKKCFKDQGKGVVFFERNFRTQHLQIQVVPIGGSAIQEVKDTFMECAESESISLDEIPKHSDLKQIIPVGVPYFYAELPLGDKLLHRISKNFPLQFGREVLCESGVLNMPERADWKNCKISKEDETTMTADFKAMFKPYDFSLL
ncbi:hypothetical protein SNE40_006477 [Patella caerulea]|uniref:CWF19-like protein 1 n=1 Tax=Patella caerulea TaxID=87958 RepID=A0AAN8JWA1_PATCE